MVGGCGRPTGRMPWFSNRCGHCRGLLHRGRRPERVPVAYFGPLGGSGRPAPTRLPGQPRYAAAMVSGRTGDHEAALPRPVVEHGAGGPPARDRRPERRLRRSGPSTAGAWWTWAPRPRPWGRPGGARERRTRRRAGSPCCPRGSVRGTARRGRGSKGRWRRARVMALDRLGAPFWYRLGDFAGAAGGPTGDRGAAARASWLPARRGRAA